MTLKSIWERRRRQKQVYNQRITLLTARGSELDVVGSIIALERGHAWVADTGGVIGVTHKLQPWPNRQYRFAMIARILHITGPAYMEEGPILAGGTTPAECAIAFGYLAERIPPNPWDHDFRDEIQALATAWLERHSGGCTDNCVCRL